MPLQTIPPIVMASITFAFGGFVLYLFVRRGRREDLAFALTCFSMMAYDVAAAGAYGCRSPADGVVWQRAQVGILSLVAIALIQFVAVYTGQLKPPWRWAFSGYFALSALVIAGERVGLAWRPDQPSVKVVHLPWGLSAVYVEASPGPLMQIQCLMGLLAFLYLFMATLRAHRTGQARRARPLLLALCFFCLTLVNDVCVGNGFYSFVYLLEYGYLGMVLLLVFSLTAELVEAGALRAQRGLLEDQLRQAAKLEAVGRLAGGVAHDLNNQLTPILGYSELALGRAQVGGELRRYFEQIRDAADQARELTRQLLALGRKQVLKLTVVNLNQVVGESKLMLERVIPENIELRVSLDPELGSVRGDPTQLRQILLNLALNARDAMPDGGVLEVAAYQRTVTTNRPDLAANSYVVLAVRDSGVGMDESTRTRVFEPFFSTKDSGRNSGLGLASVCGIVKQHGGQVLVASAPAEGSLFEVFLPRVDAPPLAAEREPETRPRVDRRGSVLVVEDDQSVRQLVSSVLADAGFTVLVAGTPLDAMRLVTEHGSRVCLLVTDVVMPETSGPDLYRRLSESLPSLPVLFISGYPDRMVGENGRMVVPGRFLAKPFTASELIAAAEVAMADS
jgi:signal transduction histidine kinase/CheY-like chemotaxis protein